MAIDVRKLGEIEKVGDKLSKKMLRDIAAGKESLYDAYDIVQSTGKMDNNFHTISNFRKKITDKDFAKRIVDDEKVGDIVFELKKINKQIEMILKKIESNK